MTAESYQPLRSWLDAHPAAKRCVVALDRWLPLVPFLCYPVLLILLNVRFFRLFPVRKDAALDFSMDIVRSIFVPGLTFWGGTPALNRWCTRRPGDTPFPPVMR